MPTIEIEVSSYLEKKRRDLGLTQSEAAERAGISTPYWSDLENGKRSPSLHTARKVANALGSHVDEVFPPTEDDTRAIAPSKTEGGWEGWREMPPYFPGEFNTRWRESGEWEIEPVRVTIQLSHGVPVPMYEVIEESGSFKDELMGCVQDIAYRQWRLLASELDSSV